MSAALAAAEVRNMPLSRPPPRSPEALPPGIFTTLLLCFFGSCDGPFMAVISAAGVVCANNALDLSRPSLAMVMGVLMSRRCVPLERPGEPRRCSTNCRARAYGRSNPEWRVTRRSARFVRWLRDRDADRGLSGGDRQRVASVALSSVFFR
jgi:hypothetical protein